MAVVVPPGVRVEDASGNPLSGALIRVRETGTTTLANLFSDPDLTVPLWNPVQCNSAGYPSANGSNTVTVYAASAAYDLAFLSSAGGSLGLAWDDFPAFGDEGTTFQRVVTGGGRVTFTGAGGDVYLRIGDPSPDDTGGTLVIEGWDGTQLDELTANAATFNASGRLKEGGRKIASTVLTEATAFSATPTVDVSLPNTPAGVRGYRVTFFDLTFASATQPRLRLSYGGSLKSGASDYAYLIAYWSISGSAFTVGSDDAAAFIDLHGENFNGTSTISADKVGRIVLEIMTPNSGTADTLVKWEAEGYTTSATPFPTNPRGTAHGLGQYGRCDGLRLLNSNGVNVAGRYTVEALAGSGD